MLNVIIWIIIIVFIVKYWWVGALIIIGIIIIKALTNSSNQNAMLDYYDNHANMDAMEGIEFENYFAHILRKNGFYDVTVTQSSGDHGIDVIAYKDNRKYGIQCKCYTGNVGNHAVQEAFSGRAYYGCDVGVVATNSYFTQAAIDEAKKLGVELWDRGYVTKLERNSRINKNGGI